MKRSVKNVIMIIFVLLMCGAIAVTMNYAKSNSDSSGNARMPQAMNDGSGGGNGGGTPPELPSGDNNGNTNQTPPEKPEGQESNGPGNMSNESTSLSVVYYIAFGVEGLLLVAVLLYLVFSRFNKKTLKETFMAKVILIIYIVAVLLLTSGVTYLGGKITKEYFLSSGSNTAAKDNQPGAQETSVTYQGAKEITEDTTLTSGTFASAAKDQNALLVSGDAKVSLSNIQVTKTGDTDGGDTSSFYGNNSAIIAKGGASLTLDNIKVTTNASGANGVFCYGGSATTNNSSNDGTTLTISNASITTTGDNAGGIMTTGGGTTKATDLTINTSGTSSAAIRTDRGGGNVTVEGGTYTTTGTGSPSIYSTANISVSNATLEAKASEGIVIEGKNTVTLNGCELTDSNTKLNGQSTTYKNVFLYQSMSGDAADGQAEFAATDSTITTNNGDSFYVTNTNATIDLENNTITNNDSEGNFLRAQKDSWGNTGSNGGAVTLTMKNQTAAGNIVIDSISTLDMAMSEASSYEGVINAEQTAKSIKLTLDKTSKIKLTGDSYVTSLEDVDNSYSNIDLNGYKLYVNGTAINE